ncbi:MAG: glycosyltransferase [Planctomycetes bacterium]|nr:glycosyltransferase [Planctomycetota bacterium]
MKIRVLFAIGGMYGGGSERQMLRLLQNLDRDRFEPELYLVTAGGELFPELPDDLPVHIFQQRCPEPSGSFPGSAFRAQIRDLAQVLKERGIDVIFDRTYHMTLITAGAVRLRPTPRISVIVSDPQRDFETNHERFRWIKRRLLMRAYREAEITACVSTEVCRSAALYHRLSADTIETFDNLFDVARIQQRAAGSVPVQYQRKPGWTRIVASGRLCHAKAYDVLIEAMRKLVYEKQLDRIELFILGSGPLEPELREQIHNSKLDAKVILTGFLENPLPLVRSADVYCLSSRYEGMPNSLVEAILCGTPVVATDCKSGPREILENGRLGALVPPDEPQALANALEGAVQNLEAFRERANAAQSPVAERYSLSRGLKRFDELISLAQHRFEAKRK